MSIVFALPHDAEATAPPEESGTPRDGVTMTASCRRQYSIIISSVAGCTNGWSSSMMKNAPTEGGNSLMPAFMLENMPPVS